MKAVSILVSVLLGLMVLACAGEVPVSTVVDDTAPLVTSCLPAPAAVGQPRNVRLSITFDEALDSASVGTNSILLQPVSGGTAVRPSSVVLSADKKNVRVYLAGELAASTQYEVRLSKDIRNLAGLALGDHSWRFTTGTQLTKYALDLAVTAPAEGTLVRSSLTLAGTLGPVAELASLQYAVNTTNAMLSWRPIEVDPAQAGAWSYKLYTWEESFVEGTNTVYLRAVNISNETSMARVAIRVDNTMPTVRLDWPPSNTTISGTVQLRGSVLDAGGIAEVAYRIGADDTWHSVTPTGTNWTVLVDTRTYPDSMRSVTVRAIDTARNTNMVSAVASQVLVDNWSTSQSPWTDVLNIENVNSYTFGMDVKDDGTVGVAYGWGASSWARYTDTTGTTYNVGVANPDTYYRSGVTYIDLRYDEGSSSDANFTYMVRNVDLKHPYVIQEGVNVNQITHLGNSYSFGFRQIVSEYSGYGVATCYTNGQYILGLRRSFLPFGRLNKMSGLNEETSQNFGISASLEVANPITAAGLDKTYYVVYYNDVKGIVFRKFEYNGSGLFNSTMSSIVDTVGAEVTLDALTGYSGGYQNSYQTAIWVEKSQGNQIHVVYQKGNYSARQLWHAVSVDSGLTWTKRCVSDSNTRAPEIVVVNNIPYISYLSGSKIYLAKLAQGYGFVRRGGFGVAPFGEATRLRAKNGYLYLAYHDLIYSTGHIIVKKVSL